MIWRLEYKNAHGDIARLDIQKGAATPVEIIEGTEDPFLLSYELEDKNKKGFIMSSFADISIYETDTFNIDDLKTLDETALSVKWYINSVLEWTGFVVPDFFSRTIGEPAIVNLAASDRLSALKDATLDGLSEYVKLKDLAIACLAKTGMSLPLFSTIDFKAGTTNVMDVFALSDRLEDDKGKKISCYDVLRSILVLTNSTIRQRKGRWRIYNKIQHEAVVPTLNFNEVYQGAKRTIQPVFSSVGAFQEFGEPRSFPRNYTLSNSAAGWVAENGFITEFDNRELNYGQDFVPIFGDETNKTNLINRNIFVPGGSFDTQKKLSSPPFKVPFRGADSVAFTLEINARGVPETPLRYELVKRVDGVPVSFLRNDGTWSPNFTRYGGLGSYFPTNEDEDIYSGVGVDTIATIKSDVYLEESEDPDKVTLTIHILGTFAITPSGEDPIIFASAIRSAKVKFAEKSDAKGILYRTDQLGSFSKKSDPDTTIFGDFISSGLNGYFYPYSKDETSILHSPSGSNPPLSKWTTATDPTAGELPILQHVTRQMSRMFGVAHDVLSAVIDAKTFDPLAIVTNCAGEKYVIVAAMFDFLRSTVEVELQQIAYGSLQRRDFIFSYFGGGDDDGISSIGSVSGGGSYSGGGGGGSFLDKYFSFDEENDALVANVSLVSEKEIAAYFADETLPSIFDSIPFATSSKVGGIKAASTYQNGIRINSSGFLEIDPSYADSGVSSWNELTGKPTSFPPSSHNHPVSDVTGLQTALNGKLDTTVFNDLEIGGTNLLKNTASGVGWVYSSFDSETRTFTRATTSTGESFVSLNNQTRLEDNTTYTLSAWIKSDGPVKDVDYYVYSKGVTKNHHKLGIAVTANWQFVTFTFTTDSSTDYSESTIRFDNNGSKTEGVNAILYVKEPKLERGTKPTDWSPAPEDVQAEIDTASQQAQNAQTDANNANSAVGSLNTYVDGAFKDGVIDSAEAVAIEKYINSINETMAKSEESYSVVYMNTYLEGDAKMYLQNAKINLWGQRDTLINKINEVIADGKVTSTEKSQVDSAFSTFNGLMKSFTEMLEKANKAIQVKLDNLSKGYVNDLEIGAVNYILNSELKGSSTGWIKPSILSVTDTNEGVKVARTDNVSDNRGMFAQYIPNTFSLNDEVVLSAYLRLDSGTLLPNTTFIARFFNSSGANVQDITLRLFEQGVDGTYKRYYVVGKITNENIDFTKDVQIILAIPKGVSTIQMRNVQLEKGNKLTDWQPAPEDKLDIDATAYNSARLGGHLANLYPRRNVLEGISARWDFNGGINVKQGTVYQDSSGTVVGAISPLTDYGGKRALILDTNYNSNILGFQTSAGYVNRTIMDELGNWNMAKNITAQGEVTAYSSSDARLKKNIKPINNALDIISKLNPVSFNWNDKAIELNKNKDSDRINYGVIAQELEKVLPELVHQTNDYKSVDYPQLIMIMAKGIQELKLELEELKNK